MPDTLGCVQDTEHIDHAELILEAMFGCCLLKGRTVLSRSLRVLRRGSYLLDIRELDISTDGSFLPTLNHTVLWNRRILPTQYGKTWHVPQLMD
jgi:hypothetical protein